MFGRKKKEEQIKFEESNCQCEDRPITYCPKCKSVYLIDEDGDRQEVIFP